MEKQRDVLNLYHHRPRGSVVLSLDEKTMLQAQEPLHFYPMRQGRVEMRDSDYVRHGATGCLFAALNVHTGRVLGIMRKKHTHREFLSMLRKIVKATRKKVHLITDNLSIHKHKKVKEWLLKHPHVSIHFTPTHASWLNQIELWFSTFTRQKLKRGRFKSQTDQRKQIHQYIKQNNKTARPYKWTYQGKPLKA
jgi:transposase